MTLDHIEKIELSDEQADKHFDARMALARLGEGLFWLYRTVGDIERKVRHQADRENVRIAVSGGVLAGIPTGLLSCAFQWYAVSACNYAQLVGWLATRRPEAAKEYVKKVMPRLSQYRNKVAAHIAMADPRRDNEADLAASVVTEVIYAQGRLCAASLTPVLTVDDRAVPVSRDFSWSLTLAHEALVPRYWRDGPPKGFSSIKVPPGKTTLMVSWEGLLGNPT